MPGLTIEDGATRALTSALDGLALRQRVISNNLANVNTPGFKASEVNFESQLAQAVQASGELQMDTSHPQHLRAGMGPAAGQIVTRTGTSQRLDGNNVDVEREMTSLAETAIHFQAAAQIISRRLAMLRTVINEGRR